MIKSSRFFFKMVRPLNLILITLTLFFVRYFILLPHFNKISEPFTLSLPQFILLIASTLSIAAFGYIWNDYNDTVIDAINKPNNESIRIYFEGNSVYYLLASLALFSLLIGLYLCSLVGNYKCLLLQIIPIGLLWFYATHYKKQFLIGNIIIASLSVLMLLLPAFYDAKMFPPYYDYEMPVVALLIKLLFCYSIFVFLVSLMREVIKDVEDLEGDKIGGCSTLPIVWHAHKMKNYFYFLSITYLLFVIVVGYVAFPFFKLDQYVSIAFLILLPTIYVLYSVVVAANKVDYTSISTLIKLQMLAGIITMFFIRNIHAYK